jgi:hypothetical protein
MSKTRTRKTSNHTRTRLSIVPEPPGWAIRESGSGNGRRAYKTQREAVAAARKLIKAKDRGEIVVHGRDGRIRGVDTYALGGDSFDKISAIEGLRLSTEMKKMFREFARKNLSAEERRKRIIAKYGKRPA